MERRRITDERVDASREGGDRSYWGAEDGEVDVGMRFYKSNSS